MKKYRYIKPCTDSLVFSAPLMQTAISVLKGTTKTDEVDNESDILSKKHHQEDSSNSWDDELW